jgi:hypothetical protein
MSCEKHLGISASVEIAIGELAQWVNDMDAAREKLLE